MLAEVATHPHADVASIVTGARDRLGSVSTQAVYGVGNALTGAGLLRRVEPAGSPARFELETGGNHHHHLVCRQCGQILDVACATGAAPCLHPGEASGFQVDEAEVTYWGRCPGCRVVAHGASSAEPGTRTH